MENGPYLDAHGRALPAQVQLALARMDEIGDELKCQVREGRAQLDVCFAKFHAQLDAYCAKVDAVLHRQSVLIDAVIEAAMPCMGTSLEQLEILRASLAEQYNHEVRRGRLLSTCAMAFGSVVAVAAVLTWSLVA